MAIVAGRRVFICRGFEAQPRVPNLNSKICCSKRKDLGAQGRVLRHVGSRVSLPSKGYTLNPRPFLRGLLRARLSGHIYIYASIVECKAV